jgi:hypothetical protein
MPVFALILSGLLVLVLLFLRAPDAFINPQFWAEDGPIFWQQQATHGWRALFDPYAGYLLLAPRLVALVASFFDPAQAPRLYAAGAIIITMWSAVTAATCTKDWRVGALLGVTLILTPIAWGEVFARANMLQWITGPTLALVLVSAQDRNKVAFATVAAFTGPYSLFLAPVAAYQFYRRPNLSAAICLIAAACTVMFLFVGRGDPQAVGPSWSNLSFTDAAYLASAMLPRIFNSSAACILTGSMVLLLAIIVPGDDRPQRLVLLWFGAAVMAATFLKYVGQPHALDGVDAGSRYFYAPRLAMLWCAAFLSASGPLWQRTISIAFIALMIAGAYPFQRDPLPDAHWSEKIRSGAKTIEISPPGWFVTIPDTKK